MLFVKSNKSKTEVGSLELAVIDRHKLTYLNIARDVTHSDIGAREVKNSNHQNVLINFYGYHITTINKYIYIKAKYGLTCTTAAYTFKNI